MITSGRSPGAMKTVSSATWSSMFGTDIAATLIVPIGRVRSSGLPATISAPRAVRSWSSDGWRRAGSSTIDHTGSSSSRRARASASGSIVSGPTRLTMIAVIASSPNELRPMPMRSMIPAALQRWPLTTATIGRPRCRAMRALTSSSIGDDAPVKSVPSTTTKSLAASICLNRSTMRPMRARSEAPASERSAALNAWPMRSSGISYRDRMSSRSLSGTCWTIGRKKPTLETRRDSSSTRPSATIDLPLAGPMAVRYTAAAIESSVPVGCSGEHGCNNLRDDVVGCTGMNHAVAGLFQAASTQPSSMTPDTNPARQSRSTAPDRVVVDGLVVDTFIGVFDVEREARQRVRFDVEIDTVDGYADIVRDTGAYVSYAEVVEFVEERAATDEHVVLVETWAEDVASFVLADELADTVRVSVRKLDIFDGADGVGITIERRRERAGA